jgi:hypothetical protein
MQTIGHARKRPWAGRAASTTGLYRLYRTARDPVHQPDHSLCHPARRVGRPCCDSDSDWTTNQPAGTNWRGTLGKPSPLITSRNWLPGLNPSVVALLINSIYLGLWHSCTNCQSRKLFACGECPLPRPCASRSTPQLPATMNNDWGVGWGRAVAAGQLKERCGSETACRAAPRGFGIIWIRLQVHSTSRDEAGA